MTRVTIVLAVCAVLVAGSAMAQTAPPPQTTPPPAGQKPTPTPTPPPAGQKPAPTPTPAPKPEPVPFPEGAKVAFIDLQAIVQTSKLGKTGRDQMEALNAK